MLSFQEIKPKLPKRSLLNLFTKKSSLENLCSFLTPKEKFRLLCNSKEISKEFDSRIDDVFMPREYQDKIKSYGNYFEELFFQISQEMKRKAEKKGERIKLYEFEENMVKYLKYLVKKFDKIIKLSLIKLYYMDPWKLDFISKLVLSLDKNIYLVVSMSLSEFKSNEFFLCYFRPSKAINIVEIIDIVYDTCETLTRYPFQTIFEWTNIKKLIINSKEIDSIGLRFRNPKKAMKNLGYRLLNGAFFPNLNELDFRCKNAKLDMLENFLLKCSKVKKLTLKNIRFQGINNIYNNSVLTKYENLTDLKISTNLNNLNNLLFYVYPILSKIKKFELEIIDDEDEIFSDEYSLIKNKESLRINNVEDYKSKTFSKNYSKDDFIGESRDITVRKTSFIKENFGPTKQRKKKSPLNFFYDTDEQNCDKVKIDLDNSKVLSTLSNMKQCESLTYVIKEQEALINKSKNINDLINILEINKSHLKYLEINFYNDDDKNIDIYQFMDLAQKISECKKLNTFIFRYDLIGIYAEIFNKHFNLGNNLNRIFLVHDNKLDIMKIINLHPNLNSMDLEFIMDEPDYTKENYANYAFNLDKINREWKEIELTNYPINSKTLDYLRNNKNIKTCLNVCVNLTEMDDLSFKKVVKTFIN